jgi:hypothetical protein
MPHMKRNRSVDKATDPVLPRQGSIFPEEKASEMPNESLSLSPKRIMEGASTKTTVLGQILAQQSEYHELRHWGINE